MCVSLDCVYCDFWSLVSTKYKISLPSSRGLVFAWQKNSEALFLTSLTPQANTPYMCESWLCVVYCAFWTLVSTRYKISWHTSKRQHPPFLLGKKRERKKLWKIEKNIARIVKAALYECLGKSSLKLIISVLSDVLESQNYESFIHKYESINLILTNMRS